MTALSELLERYPAQFRSELEKALVAALDEAREVALEEAAIICDARAEDDLLPSEARAWMAVVAGAIRARKGQP